MTSSAYVDAQAAAEHDGVSVRTALADRAGGSDGWGCATARWRSALTASTGRPISPSPSSAIATARSRRGDRAVSLSSPSIRRRRDLRTMPSFVEPTPTYCNCHGGVAGDDGSNDAITHRDRSTKGLRTEAWASAARRVRRVPYLIQRPRGCPAGLLSCRS